MTATGNMIVKHLNREADQAEQRLRMWHRSEVGGQVSPTSAPIPPKGSDSSLREEGRIIGLRDAAHRVYLLSRGAT